jgi:hypothetical protein
MKSKMCGLSVALLIFACFLSSCSFFLNPSDNITHGAIAAGGFPPGDPASTKRGNCVEMTGVSQGVPYDYCYYTFSKPYCSTFLSECKSTPPSGKCSTTNPVPNPPPC